MRPVDNSSAPARLLSFTACAARDGMMVPSRGQCPCSSLLLWLSPAAACVDGLLVRNTAQLLRLFCFAKIDALPC